MTAACVTGAQQVLACLTALANDDGGLAYALLGELDELHLHRAAYVMAELLITELREDADQIGMPHAEYLNTLLSAVGAELAGATDGDPP